MHFEAVEVMEAMVPEKLDLFRAKRTKLIRNRSRNRDAERKGFENLLTLFRLLCSYLESEVMN